MSVKKFARGSVEALVEAAGTPSGWFRCALCGSVAWREVVAFLVDNDAPEPTSARKFHSEAHLFSWVEWLFFGGPANTEREAVAYESMRAQHLADIAAAEAAGLPVSGLRERLGAVERPLAELRKQLDGLPAVALRDPRALRDAAARSWEAASTDDERVAIEREMVGLTEEIEIRQGQLDEIGALVQTACASAVHALRTSLAVFVSATLAQRVRDPIGGDGAYFAAFPGRIPPSVAVVARLAQRAAALSFALGGDGPRAEPAAILEGLPDRLRAAVMDSCNWVPALLGRRPKQTPSYGVEAGLGDEAI